MAKGYIRILISWLSLIFRKATRQLHKTFLAILRLFRLGQCEVVSGGKEKTATLREHRLALNNQSFNQSKLPAAENETLPVPPKSEGFQLGTNTQLGPVDEESNGVVFNTQDNQNLASSIPFPQPTGILAESQPAAPEQYLDITLIPIIPTEINRYDRNVPVYARHIVQCAH